MKPLLIVGAGPVGLTMACELARYGVPVRIVDRAAQRTDKSKAIILWSRTLELLDRSGGAEPFVNAGHKVLAANIVTGDEVIGHIKMDSVQSPFPYALMLPQSDTERLLDEELARWGVTIERQVELMEFKSAPDRVEAVLRHSDGREEAVSTEWLLGCDGAHSAVRHGLGVPFAGETNKSDWILSDVHMSGYPFPDSEISVYWHRDGVFVIFPISPGRYRVIADVPPSGTEHPADPTLAEVQAIIDQRGPSGLKAFDPIWLAGFRINGRKVASYRWGRVFVAGDAAHVHSPAGGQGMNTGMQDAINLAWKLALVVRNKCNERLLDSYSPERSAVGDEVLRNAGLLTTIATLRNPIAQTVRNLAGHVMLGLQFVQHQAVSHLTEISIGYPNSPLNGPSLGTHPKAGERVAPVTGQVPIGSGDTPRFALFAEKTTSVLDLVKRFAGLIDSDVRPPLHNGGVWLVRPDGYVACSSSDAGVIGEYLNRLKPSTE